jgi:hypothetical protein
MYGCTREAGKREFVVAALLPLICTCYQLFDLMKPPQLLHVVVQVYERYEPLYKPDQPRRCTFSKAAQVDFVGCCSITATTDFAYLSADILSWTKWAPEMLSWMAAGWRRVGTLFVCGGHTSKGETTYLSVWHAQFLDEFVAAMDCGRLIQVSSWSDSKLNHSFFLSQISSRGNHAFCQCRPSSSAAGSG